MRSLVTVLAITACVACAPGDDSGDDTDYWRPDGSDTNSGDDTVPPYEVPEAVDTWGMDYDGDGFSPAAGDCDDFEANINPNAFEVADNVRDDDCDGETDEPSSDCDCGGADLVRALDLCDDRFLRSWEERFVAPGAANGSAVLERYGAGSNGLGTRHGCTYAVLATAPVDIAACDPELCPSGHRQPGTDYYYDGWFACEDGPGEPEPSPTGSDGALICDARQLVLHLTAPSNANGFSFDFVYLSTEYPEWVGEGFNDTFYAIVDRPSVSEYRNISYDEAGHEIEIDNAFFESPPTTDITGTGYDGTCLNEDFSRTVCGSSTGWLRTSWNVNPGEEFSLTFSIHDEGDGFYDSATILDNFEWSLNPVDPGTIIL
jgi:hypothetical protein